MKYPLLLKCIHSFEYGKPIKGKCYFGRKANLVARYGELVPVYNIIINPDTSVYISKNFFKIIKNNKMKHNTYIKLCCTNPTNTLTLNKYYWGIDEEHHDAWSGMSIGYRLTNDNGRSIFCSTTRFTVVKS